MKGNYYVAKWEMYFDALWCVLDHDILFEWYVTENADTVTSILLEKETLAALREWKKKARGGREGKERVKRWKTLRLGVSGTDLSVRPFFFILLRILRACLIIGAALVLHFRSIRLSFRATPRWTIYSTARFRKAVRDWITRCGSEEEEKS